MSTRSPSVLVLDSYGTLFDVSQVARALAGVVAEPHRFTALWHQKLLEYTWLATAAERFEPLHEIARRALRFTAAAYETEIPEKLQRELVDAWSTLPTFPDVKDAVARLARSFRLIILTNGTESAARRDLEQEGLLRFFTHVLSSEHARAYKPSPRIYELPLSVAGLAKTDAMYVTGNGWDAAGAHLFGYRVCRIDRKNEPTERLAARPELTVRSLAELAEKLAPTAGTMRAAG